MDLEDLWKKILTVAGIIVAAWLLCPLPEITIIVGFISGGTINQVLNIPWYFPYIGGFIGAGIGWWIFSHFGIQEKIREKLNWTFD